MYKNVILISICSIVLLLLLSTVPAGISFNQNVSKKILYSVDNSNQQQMLKGLQEVNSYLIARGISEQTGNACAIVRSNPYCDIGDWYQDRILQNIDKLQTQTVDSIDMLRIKESLTQNKGSALEAELPLFLKEVSITKGNLFLGRLLHISQLVGTVLTVLGFALIVGLFS